MKTVVFVHIPKCGGVTVRAILQRQFRPGAIFPSGMPGFQEEEKFFADFPRQPEETRANYRCLAGHHVFGIHAMIPGPSRYITLLRDPVRRTISDYYHLRANISTFSEEDKVYWTPRLKSLQDFVRDGPRSNIQTWWLSTSRFPQIRRCRGIEEAFETASKNIDAFEVAGILEQFDEFLVFLAHRFRWKTSSLFYERLNMTPHPAEEEISPDILQLIREYNYYDCRLYEKARAKFGLQARELGESFLKQVRTFKKLNGMHRWSGEKLSPGVQKGFKTMAGMFLRPGRLRNR